MAPFYFVAVVWGEEHREYFLRLLVPSLLAPGNIPALENRGAARFLVCAPDGDWAAMQGDPDFVALSNAITLTQIPIAKPGPGDNKYLAMSAAHKLATQTAFEARGFGVFMTPDTVFSDGTVRTLQRHAAAGRKLVLSAAVRFTLEGAADEIRRARRQPGEALVLGARFLADVALRHMHDETLRFDWEAPYFAPMPVCPFWRVGEEGVLFHCLTWAPLAVDYGSIEAHHTETFERWTMDGDYIHRNFGIDPDLHVVQDSDELVLVSFTPKSERPGHIEEDALAPRWYNAFPVVGHYWKLGRVRWMLETGSSDPLKRRLFTVGVRLHRGEVSEGAWRRAERRAIKVVNTALSRAGAAERATIRLVQWIDRQARWPFSLLHRPGTCVPASPVNRTLVNQSGPGSYRVARLGPPISAGRWYWEVFSPNLGVAGTGVAATGVVGMLGDDHSLNHEIGSCGRGWGWRGDGRLTHRGRRLSYGEPCDRADETLMLALDLDAGKLWFGRNGRWFGGGDPASGRGAAFEDLRGPAYPAMSSMHGAAGTAELHARLTPDAWSYAAPKGYLPLAHSAPLMPGAAASARATGGL